MMVGCSCWRSAVLCVQGAASSACARHSLHRIGEHIQAILSAQSACKVQCVGDGATCRVCVGALGVARHTAYAQLLCLALGSHTVPVPYLLSPCPIPCSSALSPVPCPCILSPTPGSCPC